MTPAEIAASARRLIATAEGDGVDIDDGNVVDLIADNLAVSLADIRAAIRADAQLARRFPNAARRVPRERTASREEQHARYIDCGPAAWDDR